MRRLLGPLAAVALLAPMLAAGPSTAAAEQEVSGSILVPNPGVGRAQRCAATTGAGTPFEQGILGHTLDVHPGRAFTLTADDPSGAQDFDIVFYKHLTPCEEGAEVTDNPHENVDGDEYGGVPPDAHTAVVTLHRGTSGASFTYREQEAADDPKRPSKDVVVAVIDTGTRVTHQEFDYRRARFKGAGKDPHRGDQIVAWWDFTTENPRGESFEEERLPRPGQIWYPRVKDPFDLHGHGTATASLAVGRNTDPIKERSFAPGYKLAVAKVGEGNGAVSGSVREAMQWATETVGADVISISIGAIAPLPETITHVHEYARVARAHGSLVVVANGNGWGGFGIGPGEPGWAKPYGESPHVLAVGATGHASPLAFGGGYGATNDPEVTSQYTQVSAAAITGDDEYELTGGTSFAAPLVSGMAARLIHEAKATGAASDPDHIERLLKHSARDTQTPPVDEGYGRLGYHEMHGPDGALAHAPHGTLPDPSSELNAFYVEEVRGSLAETWANRTDNRMEPTGIPPGTGEGVIGTSAFTGLGEAETSTFEAGRGDLVRIAFEYTEDLGNDVDLFAFEGEGPPFDAATRALDRSTNGFPVEGGPDEYIAFRAPRDGTYSVAALGWFVMGSQPFELSVRVNGDEVATASGEDYVLHSYGL